MLLLATTISVAVTLQVEIYMPTTGSLDHGTLHTVLQDSTSSTATGPLPLVSPVKEGSGTTSDANAVRFPFTSFTF